MRGFVVGSVSKNIAVAGVRAAPRAAPARHLLPPFNRPAQVLATVSAAAYYVNFYVPKKASMAALRAKNGK